MNAASLPAPNYRFDAYTFFLTLAELPAGAEEGEAAPVTAPVTAPVSAYVKRLLQLLKEQGEYGNAQIREAFSLKSRRRLRDTYINPALRDQFIEMTIPEKPNSRLQKYRLTQKGRVLLDRVDSKKKS